MQHSRLLRTLLSAATLLTTTIFFIGAVAPPAAAQKNGKKPLFTDEDLTVQRARGRGKVGTGVDLRQANDPSAPLVVKLINTYYGGGQHTGRIKILEAKIENRDQKVTQSIQLRWTLVKKAEPDKVLLEGVTPFFDVQIAPYDAPLVDIPPIYYNKIVRPLLKNGLMDEDIRVSVGVQEVRFEDGTRWQRVAHAAFIRAAFAAPPGVIKSRYHGPALPTPPAANHSRG